MIALAKGRLGTQAFQSVADDAFADIAEQAVVRHQAPLPVPLRRDGLLNPAELPVFSPDTVFDGTGLAAGENFSRLPFDGRPVFVWNHNTVLGWGYEDIKTRLMKTAH